MADISSYLAAIMAAVYGEDVRGSIHDAIDIINKVGEVVLNTGTAVTEPTSSSTGFYDGSFYINTNTMELWKCIGTDAWQSQGVLKGADGADGNGIVSIVKTATVGLVDTYTITFDDGSTETYQITNGQNGSKWYKGTAISGTGTSITGFPGTKDDFYLNSVDGYVYVCTKTGGAMVPDAAEWDYVMTLTGGGGGSITVIDNLISTSSTDALSANQGRALNEKKIEKPASASEGQILGFDGTNWEAIDAPSGGGMLPYLYIDSEAGATVTVNQPDGTVITPTAAGSGHWECKLTGGYGTYVIHSVLSGQGDATLSLAVDTVKEYHVTDTHYDFTINVTAPSGSTVRIVGGGETYTGTGTGSSQAFAVHSPSTAYTVTATQIMDGNTKTDEATVTSAATSGGSTNVTLSIEFGTINVSVAADFVTAGSTITCVNGGTSCTPKTAASSLIFRVPTTGTWTISGEISGQTYSVDANVSSLSTAVSVSLQTKAPMYPFETATDAQLAAMLDSYYNGSYDATDIATLKSTYMPIGAKRTIHINAMTADYDATTNPLGVTESHHADDYEYVIIGHEHDDLVTASSGGKTKALLTLQQDRIFYKNTTDNSYSSQYPATADEGGFMTNSYGSSGERGWNDSNRRDWCNGTFFDALPSAIQSMIKEVVKLTATNNHDSTIITADDKAFILSEYEVFATNVQSVAGEGSQYEYFETATNRYKKPTHQSYNSAYYLLRSPKQTTYPYFALVGHDGAITFDGSVGVGLFGIAPTFCI